MLFLLLILLNSINQHTNQINLKDGIFSTADNENCNYDENYSVRLITTTILCLFQCSFLSINSQSQKGGAIYVNLNTLYHQSHIISKCNISSCQGLYGGGLYFESTETSNIQITESIFSNNRAKNFGGSLYFKQTTFSITNCSFDTNKIHEATSNIYGGSNYFCYSEGTIESTNFSNNILSNFLSSTDNYIYAYGGSIHIINSSVEIKNCIFINNTSYAIPSSRFSYSNGGAICLTRSFCNLTFCEFYNNTGTGDASKVSTLGFGGGIYANISSNVIINSCQFDHNSFRNVGPSLYYVSSMGGGSVFISDSSSIIENCTFTNNFCFAHAFRKINQLNSYGAAVAVQYTNLSIKQCYFYNNSIYTFCSYEHFPRVYGGAIYFLSSLYKFETCLNCSDCEFINHTIYVNTPSSNAHGGAIYAGGFANITNCKFINSTAIEDQEEYNSNGGAIYILNGTINNCVFINNIAEYGGDIYFIQGYSRFNPNCYLNISDCIFEETMCRDFYMKSIFYYEITYNTSYPFSFTNNKIFISKSNTSQILLFNGTQPSYYLCQFRMLFQNNCINPYDESIFISEKFIINDASGLYNVTFNDAFEKTCFLPTNQFSFSDQFSKSEIFTKSEVFTETSGFSESNKFSFSVIFSISNQFSDSSSFSCSENYLFSFVSDQFSDSSSFTFYESFASNQIFTLSKEVSKVLNSFSDQFTVSSFKSLIFEQPKNHEKKKSSTIMIVAIVVSLVVVSIVSLVVFLVVKKKFIKKSIEEDQAKTDITKGKETQETKTAASIEDENEDDLDFWL